MEFKLKNWKDISLKQFYLIRDLMEVPDEYTSLNIIDVIYGIDSSSLPLQELSKYNKALEFLNTEVPVVDLKNEYELCGTTYCSNFNLSKITAAQFIDYQNYIKENKFECFLSVFFIPKEHEYNDGYDLNKVKEDLLTLDFPTVKSICFFFTIQYEKLLHLFLHYLTISVKKMNLPKEQEKEVLGKIEELDLASLELFLSSSPIAVKRTPR